MQWWGDRTFHVFITLYLPELAKMQFLGTNLGVYSGSPAKERCWGSQREGGNFALIHRIGSLWLRRKVNPPRNIKNYVLGAIEIAWW